MRPCAVLLDGQELIRGERQVINEEGLPMFDIREDLPFEEEQEQEKAKKPVVKPKDTKPQMRYLIKKGGKQIVRAFASFAIYQRQETAELKRLQVRSTSRPKPQRHRPWRQFSHRVRRRPSRRSCPTMRRPPRPESTRMRSWRSKSVV